MIFKVFTLFPEMFKGFMSSSIIGRAVKSDKIKIELIDFRNYSDDSHKKVDDSPYGGGDGMVISVQPLSAALEKVYGIEKSDMPLIVYMSPRGVKLTHRLAEKIVMENTEIAIVCGHYEGVDQRFIDTFADLEISIGDYVLTGGELPAMVFMDTLSRLGGDVLGNDTSHEDESFSNYLLEYPHYTRPSDYRGNRVPDVLLSGNHADIDMWRFVESLRITAVRRPDLFEEYVKKHLQNDKYYLSLTKRQKKEVGNVVDSLYTLI